MTMQEKVIEASGLTKVYDGNSAVRGIDFNIAGASVLAFWRRMALARAQRCG